ncbi:hypothetical protein QCA50_015355 [Cerrena zonata]|uniref:O-fucosyltransferase family protein n=1 Tax=Cerrena zonata TaxID=2478898 RepID=A0AAW0FN95_9APHY
MRHTLAAKGKILLFVLCVLGLFAGFLYRKYRPPWEFYRELATVELGESKSLLGASGSGQRYVKFKQLQGAGFNNQAQEIHLFHHLALLTNRVYVYQPFMWRHRMELQPLSGFLLGPTQGSLSSQVWDEVCPLEKVKNVTFDAEYEHRWKQATEGLDGPDECIYVENWILNWGFLESTAIHEIWPEYRKYLHSHYRWPSHIADMIHRSQTQLNLRPEPSSTEGEPYLALHFRRGDFEEHCQHLARTNQSFTSWTTLPEIQSTSVFPPRLDPFTPSSVVEHCYPDLRRILEAIDAQIRSRPHIRAIYILHDGALGPHTSIHSILSNSICIA